MAEDARNAAIEGSAEVTLEDYVKAWPAIPQFRRLRSILLILPCVWAFGWVSIVSANPGAAASPRFWSYSAPTLVLIGMCVVVLLISPRSWAKRATRDLGAGRARFYFDELGFRCEYAQHQVQVKWAGLPQHVETRDAFIVFTASQSVCVMPKRAFDAEDLVAVGSLLRERIPTKARKGRVLRLVGIWVGVVLALLAVLSLWEYSQLEPLPPAQPSE